MRGDGALLSLEYGRDGLFADPARARREARLGSDGKAAKGATRSLVHPHLSRFAQGRDTCPIHLGIGTPTSALWGLWGPFYKATTTGTRLHGEPLALACALAATPRLGFRRIGSVAAAWPQHPNGHPIPRMHSPARQAPPPQLPHTSGATRPDHPPALACGRKLSSSPRPSPCRMASR